MSQTRLFVSLSSPFARMVRIVLRVRGRASHVEEVVCHPFREKARLLEFSPVGKVPLLVEENAVFEDSRVIAERLHRHGRGANLIPDDVDLRDHMNTSLARATTLMDSAVALVMASLRTDGAPSSAREDLEWARVDRLLSQPLPLAPDRSLDLATIAWVSAISYLRFRHPSHPTEDVLGAQFAHYEHWSRARPFVDVPLEENPVSESKPS